MFKKLLPFLCLLFYQNAHAQTFEVLKERWLHAETDTARINAGLKLLENSYEVSNDSFITQNKFLHDLYLLSVKANYSTAIIKTSFYLGDYYNARSDAVKSVEFYLISLKESEYINNKNGISRAQMGIGLVHFTQNNWKAAMACLKKSLSISHIAKEPDRISTAQYLIGLCLNSLKEYKAAKFYLDSALLIKIKLKNKNRINECYMGLADAYKGMKIYDSAIVYYNKVLPDFTSLKEYYPLSLIYSSFAEIEFSKGNMEKAFTYGNKGFKYSKLFFHPLPKLFATEILY